MVESFLEKRRQSVVLEGEHSHSVPVTSGVSQGSMLEPLMFLIFINDLRSYVKSRSVFLLMTLSFTLQLNLRAIASSYKMIFLKVGKMGIQLVYGI